MRADTEARKIALEVMPMTGRPLVERLTEAALRGIETGRKTSRWIENTQENRAELRDMEDCLCDLRYSYSVCSYSKTEDRFLGVEIDNEEITRFIRIKDE